MKILAIDTSAKAASVAVCEDGGLLCEMLVNNRITHSETLLPMVQSMLQCSRLALEEIDALAVSTGPGSFTGLRIGIAAIKGLSYALDKPCIPVSTLEALAHNLLDAEGVICPVMDARCNQVYNALFTCQNGMLSRLCPDRALMIEELQTELETLGSPVFLVGDGAQMCYNKLYQQSDKIRLASPVTVMQRASSVGCIAAGLLARGQTVSSAALAADYLRLPQAERELRKKQSANGGIGK